MARITVEDCLENIPNRFSLVLIAAERTKQLLKGNETLIEDDRSNKEVVTALREIAADVVKADMSGFDEDEILHGFAGPADHSQLPPEADGDLPPEADGDLPPEADDGDVAGDLLPPAPEEAVAASAADA